MLKWRWQAIQSRKRGGGQPTRDRIGTAKEFAQNLKQSIWALFLPFGLIMGLRFGVFTPTEAGACCIVYALLVGALIYRTIHVKQLLPILRESVEATSGIMLIICASIAFGKFLTWERIPMIISEAILSICHTDWQFLLLVNILLAIVGMFFEGGAAMILFFRPAARTGCAELGCKPDPLRYRYGDQPDAGRRYPAVRRDDVRFHLDYRMYVLRLLQKRCGRG